MTQSTTGLVELKPCPFCGDQDEFNPSLSQSFRYAEPGDPDKGIVGNPDAGVVHAGHYVECDKCGCCGPDKPTEADAIEGWNTRPTDPTIAELVAALEDYRSQFGQGLECHGIPYGPAQQAAEDRAVAALTKSRSAL